MGRRFLTTPTLPTHPSAPSSPSVGDMYFDTTLGKIGVYTSSGWVYNLYQIEDGSITTSKIADGSVTSSKLAPGAAVANIGYTPVNKAGDTMSGSLTVPSLLGPNNANLLINGQNYGVEIRINEDSSGSDTFSITSGSGGSNTLVVVQNNGNVGIGTASPTQKLDVSGNISGVQFISTATTGTAPFQVSSSTLVVNLNADLLDGYHTSTNATANTIAVRDNKGYIKASGLIGPEENYLIIQNDSTSGYGVRIHIQSNDYDYQDFIVTTNIATGGYIDLFSVNKYGDVFVRNTMYVKELAITDKKLILGLYDTYAGMTGLSRALEKVYDGILAINSQGDFYGGVKVGGPGMNVVGDLSVNGTITGTLSGNASTASKLQTSRTISLGGALSGSTTFDGSTDVTISANINAGAVGTNQLADGSVTNVKVADGAITNAKIADGSVTSSKLAPGAVVGNLGYTPVNKAGDTITGTLILTNTTPLQISSTTLITNLNADLLDGYDTSVSATANTVAVRDNSGYLSSFGVFGSNTQDLLISGKNYGIELRIDEGNVGTRTLKITKTSNGGTTLLSVDSNGNTSISGTLTVTGTITGTLNGNASTATKLQNARRISLGGSLSGSTSFDGSADVTINASINSGAVDTTQLADGAVTTVKIADQAVTTSKIADGSVTYAKLAPDVVLGSGGVRIFQTTIGDGTSSTYTVTHNLNTTNIEVSLILLSTNEKIGAKVEVLNSNQIQVSFISPMASNSVKVIVIG